MTGRLAGKTLTGVLLLLGVLAGGRVRAQTDVLVGNGPGDRFGTVRPGGDVDDDGFQDLIIGAPYDDRAGVAAGSVRVVSGADGSTLYEFLGSGPGALFGFDCASAGDVDADGHDDILVGAPGDVLGTDPGIVDVYSGADGSLIHRLHGAFPGGQFGFSVTGAGDVNDDGRDDIVVGAPREDVGGIDTGSAYLFDGATGKLRNAAYGEQPGDRLGASVSGDLPDVLKGEVEPTVIIGATQGGNDGTGYVEARDRDNFQLTRIFTGQTIWDQLGTRVRLVGDITGDGVLDLIVGTDPRNEVGDPEAAGYALLFNGFNGELLNRFDGEQPGSGFGNEVAAVGDVDGDGVPDVAVGEPFADTPAEDAGRVHVFSGADFGLIEVLDGPGAGAQFGTTIAFAGDVDHDGLADFAVGAPYDDANGTDSGSVFVFGSAGWTNQGGGVPSSTGQVPRLVATGALEPGGTVSLSLDDATPLAPVTLIVGTTLAIDPETGALVPTPDLIVSDLVTDESGHLTASFTWPIEAPPAAASFYQFVVSDPSAPQGTARSNTLQGGESP